MERNATFEFKPFSKKQRKLLNWWTSTSPVKDMDGIICDGAVRSGKSIAMSLSFVMWAMACFDGKNFAMCGKTAGAFRRNVLDLLKVMLMSRGYYINDKRSEGLCIVRWGQKENYFYLFGGQDERSQDKIQGMTAAGVYFDEVALMPESFVNQACSRCSVEGAKYWFNCNPEYPSHWFKENWLDKAEQKHLLHLHFLMDDNLTLSEAKKEQYKRNFSGVFYERYILGLWTLAEGIIYPMFKNAVCETPAGEPSEWGLSIDYGTYNAFAALLWGKYNGVWHCIREYYYSGRTEGTPKTDEEYAQDMDRFTADIPAPLDVVIDPSAASFITTLRGNEPTTAQNVSTTRRYKYRVLPAINDVLNGIRDTQTAMAMGLIKFSPECKNTAKEMAGYRWDDKQDDVPIKENDHACVTGDTMLMTDKGSMRIADMAGTEGLVLSYNIKTGQPEYKPYRYCTMTKKKARIVKITTEDGRVIRCTADHPILTERGYVKAIYLKETDRLIDIAGTARHDAAQSIKVASVETDGFEDVYNLEVRSNHNFVADGLVLHNCDSCRYWVETKRIVIPQEEYRSPFG